MFPSSPGPNSTVNGLPVSATGSPGRMPEVSSYTWTTVFSPRIWMTSPMSCSVPTSTTSYIRGFRPMAVTTFLSIPSREVVMARRSPTSVKPLTKSSRPTAAISISHHQELSDHVGREPAFFPAGDEPDVLGLAVFAQDVVQDREDGQGVEMGVPRGLGQVDLLHFPEEGADAGCLDALEVARDLRIEGVLTQTGHEGGLLEPNHLAQFLLRRLVSAREEDLAIERRLGRPDSEERFQVDDINLPFEELPHESIRFRRRRDGLEQVGVVESGHPVFPGGPLGDGGGPFAKPRQRLRVNRPLESLEHVIEGRGLDELPEEFDRETAGGHEVFFDFLGRRTIDLRTNDRLDVLQVVAIQITADDCSELAFAEIVDVVVRLRQVS